MTTDYTTYPVAYRLRKVARYVRMYGLSRTLEKVRGQYHLKSEGGAPGGQWLNPSRKYPGDGSVGILGCGNFAYSNIAYYCHKARPGEIRAAYDPNGPRAVSLIKRYGGIYAAESPDEVIRDPKIKLVFVASNHSTHADYAVRAIEAGKAVHIEKPHVVNRDQLNRLLGAIRANPEVPVFLGFNRPKSRHFRILQETLARETGPAMINWFIAGHALDPDHWYFSDAEGGRILGNLCHWSDLTLRLVGLEKAFPIRISTIKPLGSDSDFGILLGFADSSMGVISFSAKGHTFEGVREYLNVHKGNALCCLQDFERLSIDVLHKKKVVRGLHRDHGHQATILASLQRRDGESVAHIAETANLFLGIKEAVDTGVSLILERVVSERALDGLGSS